MNFKKIISTIMIVAILLTGVLPTIIYAAATASQIKACLENIHLSDDGTRFQAVIPSSLLPDPSDPNNPNTMQVTTASDVNGRLGLVIGEEFYVLEVTAQYNGQELSFRFETAMLSPTNDMILYFSPLPPEAYGNSGLDPTLNYEEATPYVSNNGGGLNSLEAMIAGLLNGISNAVNTLVAGVLGRMVTIDDLVFNEYPDTQLSYFSNSMPANGSKLIWGQSGDGTGGLYETVNEWYSYFRSFAIIGYMAMLVYMGIRIMLASTGEKLSQYKTLFMYWVLGVAILFFYPYVMKYAIELNDAFVKIISDSRSVITGANQSIKASNINSATISSMTSIDDAIFLEIDSSPFDLSGNDYMSVIARQAQESKRFAMAVAYMIMTWQLITLIVHYYKRLLMTGFLITIFPLVTLSYAIDRIADGKSQSFNKWNKEFILNVFIQSFHAIVYIFVCGTVYAGNGAINGTYDFILIITGVTFMFTGEEIIKKIFSQESPAGSVKSLVATAATAYGAAKLAQGVVTGVAKPIIGKDSLYNKVRNAHADAEASRIESGLFDRYAQPMQSPNTGVRLDSFQNEMERIDNDPTLTTEAERHAAKQRALEVANAVSDLNNPNSRSAEELARAQQVIQKALTDPNYAHCASIINDGSKLTTDQLESMTALKGEVAMMIASGVTDRQIVESHVTMRLGYILDGMDVEAQDRYQNMFMTNVALYGANRGYTRVNTIEELESIESDINDLSNSFVYPSAMGVYTSAQMERRQEVLSSSYDAYDDSDDDADSMRKLSYSIEVFKRRNSGDYTAEEQLDALKEIRELAETNAESQAMVDEIEEDLDVSMHILAKKVSESTDVSDAARDKANDILVEFESVDMRDGFTDDEFSIHEVISKMGSTDDRTEMFNSVHSARRVTNHAETVMSQDMFTDILAEHGVDIKEGGLDTTTRYFNGKTKEQIEHERINRNIGNIRRLAGFSRGVENESINQAYLENLRRYNAHFQGDAPREP